MGQESSDLLCNGSWKVLGQVNSNLCWGVGISLRLHFHRLSACASGVQER